MLHQMHTKGHMLVLKDTSGKLLFGGEEVATELVSFWSTVMTQTGASIADRLNYVSDLPRQRRGAGKVLWCDPTLDMVFAALSELDPSSPLRRDVFSGAFYRKYKPHFAPVLLELIQAAATARTLPAKLIKGMTRCIRKE